MLIALIIFIPVFLLTLSLVVRRVVLLGLINAAGYAALLAACIAFLRDFLAKGGAAVTLSGFIYIDYLSVLFLVTTAVVGLAASVYSIGYISAEVEEGKISARKAGAYFHLLNLFCLAMLAVPLLNNLALVWIAIEMTTLISAFLVGFHNVKESIEAAWKYIVICSVGITFALLGMIFFYYTSSKDAGIRSLEWTSMLSGSGMFDPKIVKIALIFIFVGYGTKSGLAPMHNWLPDAHSQALSPASGLLSGVLLKISLYVILRFVILANRSVGYAFSANLFLLFGLLSLGIAAGFILVQKDLKRLLAYSSLEHMGVISVGLGLGAGGGVFAALFHVFNHAVTKAFMFFCAGSASRLYGSSNMNKMQGMLQAMPFTGLAMFIGTFALAGMPPFSIFMSEILTLIAGFGARHYLASALVLLFLTIAFAGLIQHIGKVVLGNKPREIVRQGEALSGKVALIFLGIFILMLGLKMPQPFYDLLTGCQQVIKGI